MRPVAALLLIIAAIVTVAGCASDAPVQRGDNATATAAELDAALRQLQDRQEANFGNTTLSWARKSRILETAYAASVFGQTKPGDAALATLPIAALRDRLAAATMLTFYTADPAFTAPSQRYLRALATRGQATSREYERLYSGFVRTRQFAHARQLLRDHPDMDVAPFGTIDDVVPPSSRQPSVLAFAADDSTVIHRLAHLDPQQQIIVVASPMCHFTQNAVRSLVQHPTIWRALTAHSLWLAPQGGGNLYAAEFRAWNAAIPRASTAIAYRQSDWPMVTYWGTPTFYFMRDGKVIKRVVGWPADGHLKGVIDGMRAIGIDVASDRSTQSAPSGQR